MAIRRDSLRAQTDFFSPMTGNTGTQIRYADAPVRRQETYGSRVKERLSDIGKGTRRAAPIMEAIKVAVQKTDDPFTQIAEKKSYAPPEENDFMGALEGAGNIEEAIQAVGDVVEPIASSGGSNQRAAQRRADQQFARQEKNPSPRTSTAALVARDNRRYGNTVPSGSFGSGSLSTIKASPTSVVDTNIKRHVVGPSTVQPGAVPKPTPKQVTMGTTFTGIGTRHFTKTFKQQPKTVTIGGQTVAAKQSVASLPSNYKSTEAKAFAKAKAYQGQKAAAKAAAEGKTKAQQAAAARKATGTSIGAAKAANRASMKAKAAARHASFKKAKAAGTHARTASAQRARNKAAAKARAKAAAKARNKRSKKGRKGGGKKGGGGGCPDPMMLILMANGSQKRAGDLKVGDLIKTNHEKDLKLGEYKVEYVNVLNNRQKAKFTFEESEIVCSLTHKFYVDNDWKEAKDMVIGDEVSGQKLISIENVEDGNVVHITVEDAHTYICEGLLSHNKRCDIKTKVDISDLTDMNLLRDDLADVAYFVRGLREV